MKANKVPLMEAVGKFMTEPSTPQGPRKILIVGAEVSPFANVGGFSRVTEALSKAMKNLGYDVRLMMPKFGFIDESKYKTEIVYAGLEVPTDQDEPRSLICNVKKHISHDGIPVYFLENMEYYELRSNVYGYVDDPIRWALLCRGTLEFLKKGDWVPDVIHVNDWHTAVLPNYLVTKYLDSPKLADITTVLTIHNLRFQGNLDPLHVPELDFDDGRSPVASFFSERLPKQNFMRRGIIYADAVNTVSETYSREMLTPEYGEGLDKLLAEVRSKLFGIVNGIDYQEYDPATDKFLAANYDYRHLDKRPLNKLALQKEFSLEQDTQIPVLGYVGRMDDQKGIDLAVEVLTPLLKDFNVQFVAVGGGDSKYTDLLRGLQQQFPKKVGTHLLPNFTLPRLVFSGADIMLMPSRFEPCGIVQLEAMRYGAIPVVRATGGLADTVENYNPISGRGTGFVFKEFDKWAFFAQLVRALEVYNHKETWRDLILRAMRKDFSWEASAKKYLDLYLKARHFHQRALETPPYALG
ncbi:MAG: glycogen/starch synthase [bacterium]|nr:glycogen/starch synthase [bacterium]